MNLMVYEVITIAVIGVFTIYMGISSWGDALENGEEETIWRLRARRIGTAKANRRQALFGEHVLKPEIGLPVGRYLAGNRMLDDLYIDTSGKRFRLFLNVQADRVYLSILKGEVRIQNHRYGPDETKRIELSDWSKIQMDDVELQFIREKVL